MSHTVDNCLPLLPSALACFFFLTFLTHFVCSIHSAQWPIYNLDIVNITTMHREEFFKWQRNGGRAVCGWQADGLPCRGSIDIARSHFCCENFPSNRMKIVFIGKLAMIAAVGQLEMSRTDRGPIDMPIISESLATKDRCRYPADGIAIKIQWLDNERCVDHWQDRDRDKVRERERKSKNSEIICFYLHGHRSSGRQTFLN